MSAPAPPRSPFLYLVTDPWIAISWLLLIGTGMIFVLLRLALNPTPPTIFDVIAFFLITGYCFWSMYFGLAACWRHTIKMLSRTGSMWVAIVL